MRIKRRHHDGIPVVEFAGKLEGGDDNLRLLDTIDEIAREGALDIILDLHHVPFISSTGLGILMRVRNRFMRHGGAIRLCGLNNRNLNLLMVTRTALLFDVYDSEREAIAAAHAA
jgi:anti-anti-sigma factor